MKTTISTTSINQDKLKLSIARLNALKNPINRAILNYISNHPSCTIAEVAHHTKKSYSHAAVRVSLLRNLNLLWDYKCMKDERYSLLRPNHNLIEKIRIAVRRFNLGSI